ncbi:TPA: hypothetical protein DCX15_05690 [bacterium]|nr:hypothetical protein [bacterium]
MDTKTFLEKRPRSITIERGDKDIGIFRAYQGEKTRLGGDFIQTQAIYDLNRFKEVGKREERVEQEESILVILIPLGLLSTV